MHDIRINEPGAGEWIMEQCASVFHPKLHHSIAHYRSGDQIAGGFVFAHYMGGSIAAHAAGRDARWCSRELLSIAFHYAFRQLQCYKLLATVESDNYRALAVDFRVGFQLEAVIRDAFAPGRHLMILGMERDKCPWLKRSPQLYYPGSIARKATRDG